MTLDSMPTVIILLVALSMATERAVEIVKSMTPWLDLVKEDPKAEGRRRAAIQFMGVVFGILIAWLAWPVVGEVMTNSVDTRREKSTILALGLLSSGGSAFWNSLLGIVLNLKVAKGAEAKVKQELANNPVTTVIPHPDEGQLA